MVVLPHLRPYQAEDWPSVCKIYDLSKPDELAGVVSPEAISPLDADESMKKLFEESAILVAALEEKVVGFAGSRGSFVAWLFVHPGFRRTGVARALLAELLRSLDRPVRLNVVSGNSAARSLYEKIGFQVEREFAGAFQGAACSVARLRLA